MNAPFNQQVQKTPDITLSGETVDRLVICLNNSTILAKGHDGAMHPFVDPQPIMQIIMGALQEAVRPRQEDN
jgi:hypothetical protein